MLVSFQLRHMIFFRRRSKRLYLFRQLIKSGWFFFQHQRVKSFSIKESLLDGAKTLVRAQVENKLTFATAIVPLWEGWMVNRNQSAQFHLKTYLVPVSSGYYVIEMAT